jgi:hypothetical protein
MVFACVERLGELLGDIWVSLTHSFQEEIKRGSGRIGRCPCRRARAAIGGCSDIVKYLYQPQADTGIGVGVEFWIAPRTGVAIGRQFITMWIIFRHSLLNYDEFSTQVKIISHGPMRFVPLRCSSVVCLHAGGVGACESRALAN